MFQQINICIIFPSAYSTSNSKPSNKHTTCLGLISKLSQHSYDYNISDINYITKYNFLHCTFFEDGFNETMKFYLFIQYVCVDNSNMTIDSNLYLVI